MSRPERIASLACLSLLLLLMPAAAPSAQATLYQFDMDSDQGHPGSYYTYGTFTSVKMTDIYSDSVGWGWQSSPAGTPAPNGQRDRGAITTGAYVTLSDLLRDLHFDEVDRTFTVNTGVGAATVTVYIYDKSYMHDNIQVFAEGASQFTTGGIAAGNLVTQTFTVSVGGDGQLDLTFHDAGGTNPHWVIAGLEINFVPLPPSALLLGTGLLGMAAFGRRRLKLNR